MLKSFAISNEFITEKQKIMISDFLKNVFSLPIPREIIAVLQKHIRFSLHEEGLILDNEEEEKNYFWVEKAAIIIHKLSNYPLTTQWELMKVLEIRKEDLIKLNKTLRKSSFIQSLIVECGSGTKYWKNTILPLIQSGKLDTVVKNKYQYPYRVGVYVGQSCMFDCFFCGRHPIAKYKKLDTKKGNEIFKQVLKDAPKDDPFRFYISGGLEPLTNYGLGDIVKFGTELGFKFSLYTNGFLLTPSLLKKQNGLWNLDLVRISIFGVDEESTKSVTKMKNAFYKIVENAKEFLRLRDKQKSKVKFGFNFVVLPGCSNQIMNLAELIAMINKESAADRQVDFLTLREDYSYGRGKYENKSELVDVFRKLNLRKEEDDLIDLYIDYGYALYGSSIGSLGKSLYKVSHEAILPKGYPQISVVVDLLGDVYLYREAGFLNREGVHRYKIGRLSSQQSMNNIINEFITSGTAIPSEKNDTNFFDAFDHVVTGLVNQYICDLNFDIPFEKGPVLSRIYNKDKSTDYPLAHPTLEHSNFSVK